MSYNMKKVFIAILAVAALAACNKSEVIETPKGAAIAFDNAFVDNATKASDHTNDNLQDFGVYGSVEANNTSGIIFNNTRVYKSDGAFAYNDVQYWIASAQYYFTAFAPYTGAEWEYTTATDKAAQTGTLSIDNTAAGASQDLLYAYTKPDKTPEAITTQPAKVGFTFKHMLSKVAFKFVNGFAENSNITLKVYDVVISNTAANGEMTVTEGVDGNWTGTNDLSLTFGPATADEATVIAENNGEYATPHFYLIPVSREYQISFKVDLIQAGVKVATYDHPVKMVVNLAKGTNYCLSATLNNDNVNPESQLFPIEFKVDSVEGWTEGPVTLQ